MRTQPFAAYEPSPARRQRPAQAALAEACAADVAGLAALQVSVRGGAAAAWAARIAPLVGTDRAAVVIARIDGVLAGYGSVSYLPEHPGARAPAGYYLTGVSVAHEWRRRGVATALTRWRLDWALARADSCWCFISAANRSSLDLHGRLGFTEVSRGPGFQGVTFEAGEGALLRARRPGDDSG